MHQKRKRQGDWRRHNFGKDTNFGKLKANGEGSIVFQLLAFNLYMIKTFGYRINSIFY